MAKKPLLDTASSEKLTSSPFAGLAGLSEQVDEGEPPPPAAGSSRAPDPQTVSDWDPTRTAKAVVRREKKGRGGKTATVIEGLRATEHELDRIAQRLRKELGCGVRPEGAVVVIQGAQTDRVCAWLRSVGVRKVVAGN